MKLPLTFILGNRSDQARASQGEQSPGSHAGFTRWELVVVLATVGLLGSIVLPVLANTSQSSGLAVCANNLRLIGRGLQVWAKDHNYTWPWRVPVAEGGTASGNRVGSAWLEFTWVSNELVTPKILACPSDTQTRQDATSWGREPEGGFLHPAYRANALSYWIGLDAGLVRGGTTSIELTPDHAVSGDRNLSVDAFSSGCSSGVINAASILTRPESAMRTRWTNSIHGLAGNLLCNDGRVLPTSTPALRQAMSRADDNGTAHLLPPK